MVKWAIEKALQIGRRTGYRARAFWCSAELGIRLTIAFAFPSLWGSAKSQAATEIRMVRRQNRWDQREPEDFLDRFTGLLDQHLAPITFALLIILAGNLFLANVKPWVLFDPIHLTATIMHDYPEFQACTSGVTNCSNGDNYHALLGTIQAVILGLLIPIAISAYELMLKERRLRDEMKEFVMREARVELITRSSVAFLVWLGAVELLKLNMPGFRLAIYTNLLEWVWVSANLLLTVFFMGKIMGLLSQFNFNRAMRRFILRRAYPAELIGKIADLRYRNLTRHQGDQS